jgi:hypothetical protein
MGAECMAEFRDHDCTAEGGVLFGMEPWIFATGNDVGESGPRLCGKVSEIESGRDD